MEQVTIGKDVFENLQKQASMFRNLQRMSSTGWWKIDFEAHEFFCSEVLQDAFQFQQLPVTPEDFRALIHPDHRERVIRSFSMFVDLGFYEEEFPVMTRAGYVWIRSELGPKEVNADGHTIAQGYMRYLDEGEVRQDREELASRQLRELLGRHNSVSHSLLTLLKNPDTTDVITETLDNLLRQFDGDRVYIFEYDWERKTQSCTYEVTRSGIAPEKDTLQNLSTDSTKWWTEQLSNRTPIILDELGRLPSGAEDVYDVLERQGIRSIIAVPLVSKSGTWGYLGIDIVGRSRIWSDIDQQWFLSIANVISVCMELRRSEIAARKEKEYFRNLYMHMPLGYFQLELCYDDQRQPVDFLVLDVNPAFEKFTGLTREQAIGRRATELNFPFDIPGLLSIRETVASGGVISDQQTRTADGKYFNSIIYSSDKECCTVLFSETTATIRAVEALRRSEEMLQNIYNGIPVGIEVYDKDGRLRDINNRDLEIFGLDSKEQVLGVNLFENPNVPVEQMNALRHKQNIEFELTYDFARINNGYYRSKYGGVKNLLVKGTPLYDERNDVEDYILIVIDNTESLNTYKRLNEFEFLFNYIAESAEIGICRWTPYEKLITASNQWYANLNQEVRPLDDLDQAYTQVHPDDHERVSCFFREALAGRVDNLRTEIRVLHDDGECRWLRSNYKVKADSRDPRAVEIVGLNLDITELKRTEARLIEAKTKAEESDRLKSAFLANMSHEIRTPLNAIVGFSNLLADAQQESERCEYVSIIEKNNELLLQLISDILDLSKIEAGMMEITSECVDVNALCSELVDSYRVNPALSVALSFDRPAEECVIDSDKRRLTQVLSNFLSNSVKFTREGSIRLGWECSGGGLRFYVKDTGTGIAPGQLQTIFDRFIKLDNFVQGTGLGLSICKSIVEKLGGEIGAESEPGKGSCFWFTLPYKSSLDPIVKPLEINDTLETNSGDGRKPLILVAEDTDSNYLLVSTILRADYEVVRACDGVEAVEKFFERKPDAVLMDVRMPRMDGLEATRRIRERDTATPIVALTAFAFDSDRQKAFDAGCNDYMTKPINPSALKNMLSAILRK